MAKGDNMTLEEFFAEHKRVALAFSGGVDSALLFCVAKKYGVKFSAYFAHSEFQPSFEVDDVKKVAQLLDMPVKILEIRVLNDEDIAQNPQNRCYFCKRKIFGAICEQAKLDGYDILIDGTNASDDALDRPGMRALEEYGVLSPLRICGITKSDVREMSKKEGLFTWNKPSYSCLATRVCCGERITNENLQRIEAGEKALFDMGFSDFRLRVKGNCGVLQLHEKDKELYAESKEEIIEKLSGMFDEIKLGEWRK